MLLVSGFIVTVIKIYPERNMKVCTNLMLIHMNCRDISLITAKVKPKPLEIMSLCTKFHGNPSKSCFSL